MYVLIPHHKDTDIKQKILSKMSLPIDTFRIINEYMPFSDKYKACSSSDELQCLVLEDLSMTINDIVNVFNEGDMNQIQFALKHCKQDIELKLHECIELITNVDSIIFIIQEFLTKLCRFLVTPMYIDDNSDFSIMYDLYEEVSIDEYKISSSDCYQRTSDTFDGKYSDEEVILSFGYYLTQDDELNCITDFDDLQIFDNPKTEYERRLNLLMGINEKIDTDLKYYCLLKYVPGTIVAVDYGKMFAEVIKTPNDTDIIGIVFQFNINYHEYVFLTNEIFEHCIKLHDDNFDRLFDMRYSVFKQVSLDMLINCYNRIPSIRFNKILKSMNIQTIMEQLSQHIKHVPIDLLILILDHHRDMGQDTFLYDPIPTISKIIKHNDMDKLEIFTNHIDNKYENDYTDLINVLLMINLYSAKNW
ncbi:hypothetical protein D3C87_940170 [compost metagenome]